MLLKFYIKTKQLIQNLFQLGIQHNKSLISSVPGAATGIDAAVFLTGEGLTCPWIVRGGGAVLYGGDTVGVLGDKDGTNPWIPPGNGADVRGGDASGGWESDPGLSKLEAYLDGLKIINIL